MKIERSRIAANVSLVDRSIQYERRLARVTESGVRAVEFWWPFSSPDPTPHEVAAFVALLRKFDVDLIAMNLFGGNPYLGDRGVVTSPGYEQRIEQSLGVAVEVARETGCALFNVPTGYGELAMQDPASPVMARLRRIADRLGAVGGSILLEPLTDDGNRYPLTSMQQCRDLRAALQSDAVNNCGILLDTFHLANNGYDVAKEIRAYASDIIHVQVADSPGRGAPGTGTVDFTAVLQSLREVEYDGMIACEFTGSDRDGGLLAWVDDFPDQISASPTG